MPELDYLDLKISVGWSGVFHVQLRSLDRKFTKDELATLLYPIFDKIEKEGKIEQSGS